MAIARPTEAVDQTVAAVVSPRTLPLSRKITPAPRKPIPLTICAEMRVGSAASLEYIERRPKRHGRLVLDHETLICHIRKNLPAIESAEDGATVDLLNKRLAVHEKTAWMLRSSL